MCGLLRGEGWRHYACNVCGRVAPCSSTRITVNANTTENYIFTTPFFSPMKFFFLYCFIKAFVVSVRICNRTEHSYCGIAWNSSLLLYNRALSNTNSVCFNFDRRERSRSSPVFLNCRSAARYWALASIITGRERFSWNW